jgi:predicted secreted protein
MVGQVMLRIRETPPPNDFQMPLGEELEITLHEHRMSGFRWTVDKAGEPACALIADAYEPASDAIGSGGTHRWVFKAQQVGTGTIALSYHRPWEKKPPARTFSMHVKIVP